MEGSSDGLLRAIAAALEGDPGNVDLRAHYAHLLLNAGKQGEARREAQAVLQTNPDHSGALTVIERTRDEEEQEEEQEPEQVQPGEPVKLRQFRVVKGGTSEENWRVEKAEVRLADVAGLDQVKRRLQLSVFAQLRNPEMRKLFGKSLRGGLLLYGPPGCGKTFIARATAGELGARFMGIGLHDVLDMYLGESERKLHELFETARRNAPCVLFFDEIDALGRKRSLQRHSAGRDVVNQLLAEMDSMGANNEGLFILAATNHPWDVDTALRRPGRFDRMIFVGPPDPPAREAILGYHMKERHAAQVDLKAVAQKTEGFSGADLAHLCDTAAERAMEASLDSGKVRPIDQKDFSGALEEVRPSTRAWLDTARNYAMFANEGGAYDDLLEYLKSVRLV